jgi:hypothetical protein
MLKPQEGAIMNHLKLVVLVAALTLPVSSTQALEWVKYDGTIPDNAIRVFEGTVTDMPEARPICRYESNIGQVFGQGCIGIRVDDDSLDPPFNLFIRTRGFQILSVGEPGSLEEEFERYDWVGDVGSRDTFRDAFCGNPTSFGFPPLVIDNGECPSDGDGKYGRDDRALYEWLKEALGEEEKLQEYIKEHQIDVNFGSIRDRTFLITD